MQATKVKIGGSMRPKKKLAIQIDASVYAIETYFDKHPPSLADETYF